MSNSDTEKKIIQSATNEAMIKQFNNDIGINATVKRESVSNSLAETENGKLRDIGTALNPVPDTLKHMGSCAVHVYQSEILGQLFFVAQTQTLQDCPEILASKAIEDLRGSTMEFYGRKRQTKRSGF